MTDFDKLYGYIKDTTPKEPTTNESEKSYRIRIGNEGHDRPPIENPQDIVENRPSPIRKDTQE
jgi:hypothetical protein